MEHHDDGFAEEYSDDIYNDNDFYAKSVMWTIIGLAIYAFTFIGFMKYVVLMYGGNVGG